MPGDETSETWYVRTRGRILGPLTWSQLRALRDRGQLARFDQLSRDRQDWISADRLEALFPTAGSSGAFVSGFEPSPSCPSPRREPAPDSDANPNIFMMLDPEEEPSQGVASAMPAADASNDWYYAEGGTPQGPVGLSVLARLASEGRIGPATLHWRSGLDQWTPGADIRELSRLWPSARKSPAPSTPEKPVAPTVPVAPLAMISLIANLLCGIGNVASVIVGALALRQIARSGGELSGRRHAIAGMVLGVVGLLICVMFYFLIASRPPVP